MAPGRTYVLGTRGSRLAKSQTQAVLEQLQEAHPNSHWQVKSVTTGGDRRPEEPIAMLGVGAFVKELELALLRGEIDVAVHSLKDLPTSTDDRLTLAAVTKRQDPRDALVNRWNLPLRELPKGARIGTGSARRASQLLHLRPDLQVLPIRGNVDTRLSKARGQDYDGVVLALAGLLRLGRQGEAAQIFDPQDMIPAPGQGAIALEIRDEDETLAALLQAIQDPYTAAAVAAERALLTLLGGWCEIPFGAYASVEEGKVTLTGMLAVETGGKVYRSTDTGSVGDPEGVAKEVYRRLREQGAMLVLRPSEGVQR